MKPYSLPILFAASSLSSAQTVLTSAAYNGHTYSLLSNSRWTDAEAKAVLMGGHLVTIDDAAEDAWIFDAFSGFGGVGRRLWIGLNDVAIEGTFVWAGSETSSYRNWYPGQPDNDGDAEDYVHISAPSDGFPGMWNDLRDVERIALEPELYGVVEFNAVPEPASLAALGLGALALLRRRRGA